MKIIVWVGAGIMFICSLGIMIMIACDYRNRIRRIDDNYQDLEDNE